MAVVSELAKRFRLDLANTFARNVEEAADLLQRTAVAVGKAETKIDNLTQEVRQHNGFAQKIPVLEANYNNLEHRVNELEKYHKQPN